MSLLYLIAFLVSDQPSDQEIAASTDNLLSSLVGFLSNKPDQDNIDLHDDDQSIVVYHSLCQV